NGIPTRRDIRCYTCLMRRKIRRDAREAEGAPLLREYRVKSLIEGSNPSLSARYAKRPFRGVLRIWRRERCGRTLLGSTILSGTKLDSRRLAPQRAARRGWAHGWAQQSPRTSRNSGAPRKVRFAYLAEREVWTNPPGSTNSPGANLDSRRLALERGRVRPMDGSNNPHELHVTV